MANLATYIFVVGLLAIGRLAYQLVRFVRIYFVKPSRLQDYLQGDTRPFCIVTGATDGIGKELAKQLYVSGFSLYIHGRNPEKIRAVQAEIQSLTPNLNRFTGKPEVRTWLADASSYDVDFDAFRRELEERDARVTLLVNNVGGSPIFREEMYELSREQVDGLMNMNARFPTHLIRTLVPVMQKPGGPALVLNIGSFAGTAPPPYLSIYASSKAFIIMLTRALRSDTVFVGRSSLASRVQFMHLDIGNVLSATNHTPVSFFVPSSTDLARSIIDRVGCGESTVTPYWTHALMFDLFVRFLPNSVADAVYRLGIKDLHSHHPIVKKNQ